MKARLLAPLIVLTFVFCLPIPTQAEEITDSKIFEFCSTVSHVNCFESIQAVDEKGNIHEGELTGRVGRQPLNTTDVSFKHLVGLPQEWEFPSLKFQNGSGKILIFSFYIPKDFRICYNNGTCQLNREQFVTWMRPSDIDGKREGFVVTGANAKLACPDGRDPCSFGGPPWRFDQNIKFILNARLPSDFYASFTIGRAKNFTLLEVSRNNQNSRFQTTFSPLELENVIFSVRDKSVFPQGLYVTDEPAIWISGSNNDGVIRFGNCWDPATAKDSTGVKVLTNATTQGLPYWSSADQMIKVDVKAPHLKTNGDVNQGYLEVAIPVKQAQCMWGINLSDAVATTVQITDTDNTTQIFTSVAKLINGLYELRITGFHYSSPTIGVKFENRPSANAPKASSLKVLRKKSLICVKGKSVKIVSSKNCPAGYKKKI